MNLKESILQKLDYESIARGVYEILKDEIKDEVLNGIDEDDIINGIAEEYSNQLVEIAKDKAIAEIVYSVDYNDIEEEFKDVVEEELF